MPKSTITDIAKAAGVSVSTASKALSGKGRMQEETRRRIVHIAEELGYVPNKFAQALPRKSLTVGVVIPDVPHEVQYYIQKGINEGFASASEYGVRPLIRTYGGGQDTNGLIAAVEELKNKVSGLIVEGTGACGAQLQEMIGRGVPVVTLVTAVNGLDGAGGVSVEGNVVGRMAAQFLYLVGARKAAVLAGDKELPLHRSNLRGFIEEGKSLGLETVAVENTFDRMEEAGRLTEQLLEKRPELSGIFTSSYVAPAICEVVKRHGMQDRMKVVGLDLYRGTITCLEDGSLSAVIFQNQVLQARTAVQLMLEALHSGRVQTRQIRPELVMTSNLACYRELISEEL